MPANATGWFWHCLARETGRIGHLYSPGAQRGPWPWFPYALDNGAFSCWDMQSNSFDAVKWAEVYVKWQALIYWAASATQRARWAIVPDEPGNGQATLTKWDAYVQQVTDAEIPAALAVQDGMTVQDVKNLKLSPSVICVGGTTEWKWETVEMWATEFSRVHVLRCNSPEKLYWLEELGVESCDGTGWNRGDRKQTGGLESWARLKPNPQLYSLAGYVCRKERNGQMQWAF
jgi:hypothetical protein